jgi:LmbE family N-acetylglucosaminyl deacetylase
MICEAHFGSEIIARHRVTVVITADGKSVEQDHLMCSGCTKQTRMFNGQTLGGTCVKIKKMVLA